MKLESIISVGALVGATIFTASVSAADSGVYAGVDVGRSSTGTIMPGVTMTKSTDTVGGVFLGYQFTPNFAAEVFYTGAGKFSASSATGTGSGKSDAYGIDVVGSLPVADTFSLYGRLGYARTHTSASSTPTGLGGLNRSAANYGLGGQYDLSSQVGIRFGWDRYGAAVSNNGVTSNFNVNVWSLGVLYRF